MKLFLAALALAAVGANAQVNRRIFSARLFPRAQVNKRLVALYRHGTLRDLMPFTCTRQDDYS